MASHNNGITHARPRIFVSGKLIAADSVDTADLWAAVGVKPRERATEFTRAFLTPGTREHKRFEKEVSDRDRNILSGLAILRRTLTATSAKDQDFLDAAMRLLDWTPPKWAVRHGHPGGNAGLYRKLLTNGMKDARLVLAHTSVGDVPAVLCRDLTSAAYCFAAYRGVEVCAGCRQLFAPDPERDAKYCSKACGSRARQRAYNEHKRRTRKKSKRPQQQLKRRHRK